MVLGHITPNKRSALFMKTDYQEEVIKFFLGAVYPCCYRFFCRGFFGCLAD